MLKGYKTLLWNAANAVIAAMEMANATYQLPDAWMPYWVAVYIAGNIILRLMTTGPVGGK